MSDSIKKYPLYHETDNGTEGLDIYDAISMAPSGIYLDVPGLGLVEVSQNAAMDAMRRLNKETGANQFALGKISPRHGVCEHARVLMHWA